MGSGKELKKEYKKEGKENFKKEILFQFDNKEEMLAKEKEIVDEVFIKRSDTYNLILGGGSLITKGFVTVKDSAGSFYFVSIDDPRYLSGELNHVLKGMVTVRDKGGNTFSVSKQDIRYISGEVISSAVGVKHSDKTRAIIKEKRKDQVITKEHKENISKGNYGKIRTEEAKINYSLSKKGNRNPMVNRIWINDGIVETSIDKCCALPIGWNFGRIHKAWITNEIISKKINLKNELIPVGWRRGRKTKKQISFVEM
jgi:hypothetical protein